MAFVEVDEVARRVAAGETVWALPSPMATVTERVALGWWMGERALTFEGGGVMSLGCVTMAGPATIWVDGE